MPFAAIELTLTVAISGHRALARGEEPAPEAIAGAEARVQAVVANVLARTAQALNEARAANPLDAARPVTLRFVSGMAEGADQAGMRAAQATPGWRGEAILPFAREAFRRTFDDPAAGAKVLDELLTSGTPVLELADWTWPGLAKNHADGDYWRARRYATLGQMLVRQADLLIAVWRGKPAAGHGGTADVVVEAYRAGVPILWLHPDTLAERSLVPDDDDAGAVAIGRLADLAQADGDGAIRSSVEHVLLGSDPAKAAEIEHFLHNEALRQWCGLNGKIMIGTSASLYAFMLWAVLLFKRVPKDAIPAPDEARSKPEPLRAWQLNWVWPVVTARWRKPLAWLPRPVLGFGSSSDAKYPTDIAPEQRDAIAKATADDAPLAPFATHADVIASRKGNQYRSAYVAIFLLAALAVALAGAWLFWHDGKPLYVTLELAAIGLAIALWARLSRSGLWFVRGHDTHQGWLDARLVAETLRASQFLSWIGFGGRRVLDETEPQPKDAGHDHARGHHAQVRPVWAPGLANAIAALPAMPTGEMTPARIATLTEALDAVSVVRTFGTNRVVD